MKNKVSIIFTFLFFCLSCNNSDDTPITTDTTKATYIGTIDFSTINDVSVLVDFDIEDEHIYFIYGKSIYRINLSSDTSTVEFIIEDDMDWPNTLKVINGTLYYQGDSWATSQNVKQVDLNSISEGVQATHPIVGTSRSQFCKNSDKLYYLSSIDAFSPINNIYEFNPSSTDQLIVTDEFIHPQNMRVVDHFLYFSSKKEVRRFDLNSPTKESSIVYTVPDIENNTSNDGDIIGFDIKDNVIYFTRISINKLFAKDLEQPNEEPIELKSNGDEGVTGYGKLIIADGKLYVIKINDKQLEVFKIN